MRPDQMPGYGYLTLATWPEPWYETGRWHLHEYKVRPDGTLKWYQGFVPTDDGHAKADVYDTFEDAVLVAESRNTALLDSLNTLGLPQELYDSHRLKAIKAIQAKSRLAREEQLMLAEAIKRSDHSKSYPGHELVLPEETEPYRQRLTERLFEMPYLEIALLRGIDRPFVLLAKQDEQQWSKPLRITQRSAQIAYRSQIANGFGFPGSAHWGKTKAAIRQMLLPRANQLLQLASVQRMLAEARAQGQRVLVANGYVFWYEEDGHIGWQVKQAGTAGNSEGVTLWEKGTIFSKNHGRLVILPYIKENGEEVQGHTRNAPGDGRAKPRHPDHYIELPFSVLRDDLMIGLFGELPYE
ncbi:hypothetical protein QL995_20990 [Pseudoalteromonas sp. APC 3358]|uniref:hypothetical protein n=1 Tax=Pseudoalteromonas sp. APC 3358 TaxID=3035176 RepID=UPI0025B4BF91|nr:hypothetical protein [Pseudoalteromonas sp. APC 3358]MDN3385105.1 hypothetical protein [Pseudoalteromonas sp. APC 3358]